MMADKIVLFMVAGMLMVRQACQFIGDHQGNTPGKPVPVAIILLATAAFALALWVPGMSAQPVVLAAFLLCGRNGYSLVWGDEEVPKTMVTMVVMVVQQCERT